ncbi:MAG: hypothetical protein KAJ19_26290, partial [Gammaproteobacteria bacterium]|nr:hypothetical protein [Gammaproteobacteria bacterium]
MRKVIRIGEPEIYKKKIIEFELTCSRELKGYFSSELVRVVYDRDIHDVNPSILSIPIVSNIVTLAWATGSDIQIEELDKTFLDSLEGVKSVFRDWYPSLPLSTRIRTKRVVENRFSGERCGLLFSGGLDSTASYIRHRHKQPTLITILGGNIPPEEREIWSITKNKTTEFAAQEGIDICFVETNLPQIV